MLYLILVLASLILGLAVGRWWTLVAAAGLGAWIAVVTEVDEVPPWFLGAAYAVLAASGIAVGVVVVRRRALASPERKALSPLFAVASFPRALQDPARRPPASPRANRPSDLPGRGRSALGDAALEMST